MSASSGDSCALYALASGDTRCRHHRSCYDCLNVPVERESSGCVLTAAGLCGSMDALAAALDDMGINRSVGAPANATWSALAVLPAATTTYCNGEDAACALCYSAARNASTGGSSEEGSLFCVGASGCVCLSACEPVAWATRATPLCDLPPDVAPVPTPTPQASELVAPPGGSEGAHFGTGQLLITGVQVLGVLMLLLFGIGRQIEAPEDTRLRRAARSPRDRLRLSQWRALQQQLVEEEKERPSVAPALAAPSS